MEKPFLNRGYVPWTIVGFLIVALCSLFYTNSQRRFSKHEIVMEKHRIYIVEMLQKLEKHQTLLEQLMSERNSNER